MTLRNRMGGVAGLAVAVAVVGVAFAAYFAVRSQLRDQVDSALNDRARAFVEPRGFGGPPPGGNGGGPGAPSRGGPPDGDRGGLGRGPGGREVPPPASPSPFGGATGLVQFIGATGTISSSPDATSTLPANARDKEIAARGSGRSLTDRHVKGKHLRVLTVGRGSGRGAAQVARPLTEVDDVLSNLLIVLIVIGAGGIALAVGLGAVVARTALAPIARFTRRTEKLTGTPDLSQRLEVEGKDELARLATSFNATLDALERSAQAQRHLVADASHELRTPIASLRANIQTLRDAQRLPPHDRESLRADIVDELDELTALVGDVVELARDSEPAAVIDDVRVDEIAEAQVERARRRAGDLVFRVDVEPAVVSGQPDRISRAVSNIIHNACKWSPPGGTVDVKLADGVLSVRDRGPGFDAEDLPHVFDRFYRAGKDRTMPGSGLGLAIVRQAAESHGGFARAENADDGGAVVTVSFGPSLRLPDLGATDDEVSGEPEAAPRN
jgi:two-component system sensor histidine kinase MprB